MPRKVRDISEVGAFIENPQPWPAGREVHLSFKQSESPPVAVRAVIRRTEPEGGMAVEFVDKVATQSRHLEEFLQASSPQFTGAGAGSAGSDMEMDFGRFPAPLDGSHLPPPSKVDDDEAERSSGIGPGFFYAALGAAFICAFALGLLFFYYSGQAQSAPAATAAPPPTAEPAAEPLAPVAGLAPTQPATSAEPLRVVPEAPAPKATTRAHFAVQVGSYEARSQSEVLARRVSSFYEGAVVVAPAEVRGKTYYRVHIPVATREEARQLAARLAKEQKIKAWVYPLP